jgi:hypothetical protein
VIDPDKLNKKKAPSKGGKEEQKPEDPSLSQKHKNVKGVKKGANEQIMFQSPQQ